MKASNTFNRPLSSAFHAITVVWGREYLDLFLNRCIPNQLGEGNVAALPPGSRYRIMTRAQHVDEVQEHPMVQALGRIIPVDIVPMNALEALDRPDAARRGDSRFELMTECHRQAIAEAARAEAALLFLSPDILLSADTFAAIVRQHRAGYRAVVCAAPRVAKGPFLHAIDSSAGVVGAPPPRDLVHMALPHLHEHTRSMFADAKSFSTYPVGIYWPVGTDGLLARCLHLHPIMIDPIRWHALPTGTVDSDYVARACPDMARIHVVTDSDEFVVFELTDGKRVAHPRGKPASVERQALVDIGVVRSTGAGVSIWRAAAVAARCDDLEIDYWQRHPVHIHSEDLDERWVAAEATAEAFVRAVMWRFRPFGIRSLRWYKWLERNRQLHDRYRRAWRRRLPRFRLKQILRPMRLASARASKILKKTTRQLRQQGGAPSR